MPDWPQAALVTKKSQNTSTLFTTTFQPPNSPRNGRRLPILPASPHPTIISSDLFKPQDPKTHPPKEPPLHPPPRTPRKNISPHIHIASRLRLPSPPLAPRRRRRWDLANRILRKRYCDTIIISVPSNVRSQDWTHKTKLVTDENSCLKT